MKMEPMPVIAEPLIPHPIPEPYFTRLRRAGALACASRRDFGLNSAERAADSAQVEAIMKEIRRVLGVRP